MLKILSLALIATGVLHNTLALLTMREALRRIYEHGIFNSIERGDAQTFAFLWFMVAGFALMLIGLTFWQLADANRLGWPPILALLALATAIAIALLYPKAGPLLLLTLAIAFVIAKCGG